MASRKLVRIWTEHLLFQLFSVQSKGEERFRPKRRAFVKRQENLHKILEREVDLAVRKEGVAKYEAEAEVEAGDWEKRNSVFAFQEIRSLNVSAFSHTKQVDGQIRLREIKSACMENWN